MNELYDSNYEKQIQVFLYLYFTYNSNNSVTYEKFEFSTPNTYGCYSIDNSTFYPFSISNISGSPFTITTINNTTLSLTGTVWALVDRFTNTSLNFTSVENGYIGMQLLY